MSVNGSLSSIHASVDNEQYAMVRGLLAHNLGENLDDLAHFHAAVPTNEYQDPDMQTLLRYLFFSMTFRNCNSVNVVSSLP